MVYHISKWKMDGRQAKSSNRRLVSLSTFRTPVKPRPVAVVKPEPIIDPRELVFRHFTEIPSIDLKKKTKWGCSPKSKNVNRFLEFLDRPGNKSTAVVVSTCKWTGVCTSDNSTCPSQSTVVSDANASSRCQVTKKMKTEHRKPSAKTPSETSRPMSKTVDKALGPLVTGGVMRRTNLKRKALVKTVDPIDLIVAMFNRLSLDDKRKVKESEKEHFETFQAHRLHSRPYAKRMKMLND